VNAWLVAATVLLCGLAPCGFVALRGSRLDGLVALELAGSLVVLVLLLLAQGFQRSVYFSLALVLAAASLVGGLAFARMLERWL
jgi:multisubunit Na+/H+ antiporter MnhF subunit